MVGVHGRGIDRPFPLTHPPPPPPPLPGHSPSTFLTFLFYNQVCRSYYGESAVSCFYDFCDAEVGACGCGKGLAHMVVHLDTMLRAVFKNGKFYCDNAVARLKHALRNRQTLIDQRKVLKAAE